MDRFEGSWVYETAALPPEQSDTIAGLAEKLGLDPTKLEETVSEFNAACGPGDWDPVKMDGKKTSGITPPKSNWANLIVEAPFSGFPMTAPRQVHLWRAEGRHGRARAKHERRADPWSLRRRRDHGSLPQASTGNVGVAGEYLRTHRRHERRRITLGRGNRIGPVSLIASAPGREGIPPPALWCFTQPFTAILLGADQEERRVC